MVTENQVLGPCVSRSPDNGGGNGGSSDLAMWRTAWVDTDFSKTKAKLETRR